MPRKPTQLQRVLAASRSFRGTCQADFLLPNVVDGGPPVTRVGARIQDAEDRGYVFEVIGWRNKTKVYRLAEEPDTESGRGVSLTDEAPQPLRAPTGSTAALSTEPDTLFTPPTRQHWQEEAA